MISLAFDLQFHLEVVSKFSEIIKLRDNKYYETQKIIIFEHIFTYVRTRIPLHLTETIICVIS